MKKFLYGFLFVLLFFIIIFILLTSKVSAGSVLSSEYVTIDKDTNTISINYNGYSYTNSSVDLSEYSYFLITYINQPNTRYYVFQLCFFKNDFNPIIDANVGYFVKDNAVLYADYRLNYDYKTKAITTGSHQMAQKYISSVVLFSSGDIYDNNNNLIYNKNVVNELVSPSFVNSNVIETGKFDKVIINSGEYNSFDTQNIYLLTYYYSDSSVSDYESLFPRKEILLDGPSCSYFVGPDSNGYYIYEIPVADLGINLVESNRYGFKLAHQIFNEEYNTYMYDYFDSLSFNIGVVTAEEKAQFDRDTQISLQEEQNKTSKGIFDTIGNIFNFINPLSEDFFAYKLVELLLEGIKALFLPSEEFIHDWITSMNDWLSDRLGAIYYPIDLVVDFLNRIGSLSEDSSAVINFSGYDLMGATLIPAFSYDMNSILENETFRNIHNIYLVFVDVILYLGLVFMAQNVFVDIFGGKYLDDAVEFGYEAYDKYTKNKESERKSNFIGFRK